MARTFIISVIALRLVFEPHENFKVLEMPCAWIVVNVVVRVETGFFLLFPWYCDR